MRVVVLFLIALVLGCAPSAKAPAGHVDRARVLRDKTVALVQFDEESESVRAYCTGVWVSETAILTAAHCVASNPLARLFGLEEPPPKFVVESDVFVNGAEIKFPHARAAWVASFDDEHDLALLRTNAAPKHHGIAEMSAELIEQGLFVQSMGHAKWLWYSYSSGDVAAVRYAPIGSDPIFWIQATAPISPGNSGGGLFDENGRLLGICSRAYSGRAQNLNFWVHRMHIADFLRAQGSL
jgi:S1-C subfamily serine protease